MNNQLQNRGKSMYGMLTKGSPPVERIVLEQRVVRQWNAPLRPLGLAKPFHRFAPPSWLRLATIGL